MLLLLHIEIVVRLRGSHLCFHFDHLITRLIVKVVVCVSQPADGFILFLSRAPKYMLRERKGKLSTDPKLQTTSLS